LEIFKFHIVKNQKGIGSEKLKHFSDDLYCEYKVLLRAGCIIQDCLYIPFTCWLPGEHGDDDDFFDWYAAKKGLDTWNRRLCIDSELYHRLNFDLN